MYACRRRRWRNRTAVMDSRKNSDIDDFDSIVSQYQDRLFRFAFMRTGIREVAEDMVQDVLLRLFRARSKGFEINNTEYYLLRSIGNACIDYHRRSRPTLLPLDEAVEIPDTPDRDITEEFLRINRLLDKIPYEQAETVRLKCHDGLTFRQIAELQQIPEATVKSRYRYAIQHIKEKLNSGK